jgi:2-polyprenyl-6-hydroxyphenyl methylase/3-demethylubiquinone-9 3-methyltransferase
MSVIHTGCPISKTVDPQTSDGQAELPALTNECKMPRFSTEQLVQEEDHHPLGRAFDPRTQLSRLPPLDRRMPSARLVPCKVCGGDCTLFDRVDFNKYCDFENYYEFGFSNVSVDYLRCQNCGFLFTTFCDAWRHDDFRNFIYNEDYAKVDREYAETRPMRTASFLARRFSGAESARILDYGSGAGIFARCMRNAGFAQIEEFDPFSAPSRPKGRFDIITCLEVIEHTPDPRATLAELVSYLEPTGCIVLTQTLQPDSILSVRGSWWYLAPRNGHVSTFTEEALELLGLEHGLIFHRGETVYGFSGQSPSDFARTALASIGSPFSTLRLSAPVILPFMTIVSPENRVVWHRTETCRGRRIRWTGSHRRLQWRAKWPPVSRIRVHVPVVQEAALSFAHSCRLLLDGIEAPVKLIRGDLTSEFDVLEKICGNIELITPEPINVAGEVGRTVGLAIAIDSSEATRLQRENLLRDMNM